MNPPATTQPFVLATDLDGTLIPLHGDEQNISDLGIIASRLTLNRVELAFVTGRHLTSVLNAIRDFNLPEPDWIICDVGTSIYHKDDKLNWKLTDEYADQLRDRIGLESIHSLRADLEAIPGLRLQEEEKQGQFKLSYYVDASDLDARRSAILTLLSESDANSEIISSIDPFNGDGLLDILPSNASKADALTWLKRFRNLDDESIVFAGDSGNDLHAMTAGFKTIVVGNADRDLTAEVQAVHCSKGWSGRLYCSEKIATSGVLDGCRFFGLFNEST